MMTAKGNPLAHAKSTAHAGTRLQPVSIELQEYEFSGDLLLLQNCVVYSDTQTSHSIFLNAIAMDMR
jgi:hypothetical protein